MNTQIIYEFENSNSKMLMEVVNGAIEVNSNVQQWPANHYKCQQCL